jgi:hypothetical protein
MIIIRISLYITPDQVIFYNENIQRVDLQPGTLARSRCFGSDEIFPHCCLLESCSRIDGLNGARQSLSFLWNVRMRLWRGIGRWWWYAEAMGKDWHDCCSLWLFAVVKVSCDFLLFAARSFWAMALFLVARHCKTNVLDLEINHWFSTTLKHFVFSEYRTGMNCGVIVL